MDEPEWTLDAEGNQTGPYSAEQLIGFLKEGEILPHYKVTSERMEGRWVTLEDLLVWVEGGGKDLPGQAAPSPLPPAFTPPPGKGPGPSIPPPPPPSLSTPANQMAVNELFAALQVARDRRKAPGENPFVRVEATVWDSPSAVRSKKKAGARLGKFILLLLLVVVPLVLWYVSKK